MPGPVERWLETFMCKQYAYVFEEYGFKTLQQVCQLQSSTLHSMGIPPDHCDKIVENVSVLRQSLVASSPEHMGSHETNFPPPSSYGGRHNPQNHPYSGSGCNYPENPYDNQMASHNQYGYHPPLPTSYSPASASGQQYNGARLLHPYTNSQTYSGSQGTQYVPSEIYGQYGTRIHPTQSNWESNPVPSHDAMHAPNAYNHGQSPRHHTISSPPPHPVLRSPPPSAGMGAVANYRHMMLSNMNDQPSQQHPHATWSQSQIASPSMMHSPRTTPSPGMGHAPTNLPNSSPLLNRSPAHKPFSPPPFSPHGPPPPAHQHPMSNYENIGAQSVTPSAAPSPSPRAVATPHNNNNNNNCSDPLQSLQKMVMSEAQPIPVRNSPSIITNDTHPSRTAPNFSSIEQLVGKDQQRPPQSVESTLSSVSSPASSCHDQKLNRISPAEIDVITEDSVQKCNGVESPETGSRTDDESTTSKLTSNRNGDTALTTPLTPTTAAAAAAAAAATATSSSTLVTNSTTDQSPRGRWKQSVVNSVLNTDVKTAAKEINRTLIKSEPTCNNGPITMDTLTNKRLPDTCIVSCPPKKKGMMCFRQREDTNKDHKENDTNSDKQKEQVRADIAENERHEHAISMCRSIKNEPLPKFSVVANPALTKQHTVDLSHLSPAHLKTRLLITPSSVFADQQQQQSFPIERKQQERSEERKRRNHQSPVWTSPAGSSSQSSGDSPAKKKRGRPLGSKNKPKSPTEPTEKKIKMKKKKINNTNTNINNNNNNNNINQPVVMMTTTTIKTENESDKVEKKKTVVAIVEKTETPKVIRGPYIHVEGPKDSPLSVTVVNVHSHKHDDNDGCGGRRKKMNAAKEITNRVTPPTLSHFTKRKLAKIGFSCTLSAKYDAVTKDKTWVCELCRKGSHHKGLGDLFGPYFEQSKKNIHYESCSPTPPAADRVNVKVRAHLTRSKVVEEFFQSTTPKKGRRSRDSETSVDGTSASSSPPSDTNRTPREMWVHENCIVWSHGVYLVANKVYGLEEAVRIASDMICCKCKESGATLGCLNKGCAEQYHYACALEKGCHLDEENFSLVCFKHKRKPRQGLT